MTKPTTTQEQLRKRAEYMRKYRKSEHYVNVERPRHLARNRKKAMQWRAEAQERLRNNTRKETLKWLFNYWQGLKQEGMTDKQFIIKFDSYLKRCVYE